MTTASRRLALALATLVTACDPELDGFAADGEISFRCDPLMGTCGPLSNTPFTGAVNISPLDTQGNLYEDIQVHDVTLFGSLVLDEFWAEDGQLHGRVHGTHGPVHYDGADFLGAQFNLTAWGNPVWLYISGVTAPTPPEVFWLYEFNWDDGDGNDGSLCIPTGTGDLRALVHADLVVDPDTGDVSSRPNTVFIACLRGAAGEVAYGPLGYGFRPFELGLAAFEAAMRFLRADYCGDGTPWTKYGEDISYTDKWNIGAGVAIGHTDAVWGMDGALCIGNNLRAGFKYSDITCPTKTKPPICNKAAALYNSHGRIWSVIPDLSLITP